MLGSFPNHNILDQWRSHGGGKGGRVPPFTAKICQKSRKRGKKSGKKRKNREEKTKKKKKKKIGKVVSLCPSREIELAALLF